MKLTYRNLRAILASLLSLCATAPAGVAQTSTVTDPVGITTLNIKGTSGTKSVELTFLALSMARVTAFQGTAETVFGSTLTCSAGTWTDNQYANTPQPGYFLEVFSGAKAGLLSQIVSCNQAAKTVTVADDLNALGVETTNVTIKIRPNWSLSTLFGATNSAGLGAGTSGTADLILIYNSALGGGSGGYDQYFYSSGGLAGVGWRKVGAGNADQKDAAIALDEGLIVKRFQSADVNVDVLGAVKLGQTITSVLTGPNFIGNVYPAGVMTLGNTEATANPPRYSSGLYTGNSTTGVLAGTSGTADLILSYNSSLGNGGGYDQYYYSSGGLAGVGWRRVGSGNADQKDVVLVSGRSILIQRQSSAPGAFNWVMPQPFPTP